MGIRRVPLHAVPVSRRGSPSRQVAGQQAIDMSGGLGSDTARTFRCAGLSPPRGVSVCNGRGRRGGGRSRPLLQRLLSLYCVSDILTRALRRPCHTLRASRILSRREGSALRKMGSDLFQIHRPLMDPCAATMSDESKKASLSSP